MDNSEELIGAISLAITAVSFMVTALVLVISIYKAGRLPPAIALVIALSILTLFSMAGFIATQNAELATLAGTGLGAIAGAVTAVWQERKGDKHDNYHDDSE